MMTFEEIAAECKRSHFPNPPVDAKTIAACETKFSVQIPEEVLAFYREMNGCSFFDPQPDTARTLLRMEEWERARYVINAMDTDEYGSRYHIALLDASDGDYYLLEMDPTSVNYRKILDGFHGTYFFPGQDHDPPGIIADSFLDAIERILKSNNEFIAPK